MKNVISLNTIPKDYVILGKNRYYSTNGIETQLNNNILVVGTSGSGKTRGIIIPNILQMRGSMIISDAKGNLHKKYRRFLEENGYEVYQMNFRHPEKSCKYNPLMRIHSTSDVTMMADMLVYGLNDKAGHDFHDPFWPKSEYLLFSALLAYLLENDCIEDADKTFSLLEELIQKGGVHSDDTSYVKTTELSRLMKEHKLNMDLKGEYSWAYNRYQDFIISPPKTYNTINITTLADLIPYDNLEIRQMMSGNDIDFKRIGQVKSAVFVDVSDTNRSNDTLINLFYSQLMHELCTYADEECEDSRLPIPVTFMLDDFATNARIANFEKSIANIRSRNISAMLMVQTESQLEAGYGDDAQTIVDNCDTYVYLGGNDPGQAEKVAKRVNKTTSTILNMELCKGWICRRGHEPVMCDRFDVDAFERTLGISKSDKEELEPAV